MVGYWKFDEGSGDVVNDFFGYNNHASLGCQKNDGACVLPTWDSGKVNGGVKFINFENQTGAQFVTIPTSPITSSSSLTLMAWALSEDLSSTNAIFEFCAHDAYGPLWAEASSGVVIDTYRSSRWGVILNGVDYDPHDPLSEKSYSVIQWQLITFTYDYNSGRVKLYFNESAIIQDTVSSPITLNCTRKKVLGFNKWNGQRLKGILDEARVYNRALSELEIKAIYNAMK